MEKLDGYIYQLSHQLKGGSSSLQLYISHLVTYVSYTTHRDPASQPNMATEQSSSAFYTLTSVIEVKDIGDGKFELSEVQADEAPLPDLHSGNRKTFDYGLPVPGLKVSRSWVNNKNLSNIPLIDRSLCGYWR